MTRRLVAAVLAATALVAGSLVVTSAEGARSASAKPAITMGLSLGPTNLNAATDAGGASQTLVLADEPITYQLPNGKIGPGLATSWRYVGSGTKTFEFTLRHDARFSDGSAVTASAVKTWLDYVLAAKGPLLASFPVKSVSTQGNWTVVLHLSTNDPIMPVVLSQALNVGCVSSPKAVAHPASLATQTDGAGPYVEVPSSSVSENEYVFVPNKYYFDQSAIKFSKVTVRIITQATTMLAAIQSGQLQLAQGDPSTEAAAASAGLKIASATVGWDGLFFYDKGSVLPSGSPNPLASLQVRQAMNYAINRKAITQAIVGAHGTPTSEGPTLDGFDPKYTNYYPYDPTKAKALLAQAGYAKGFTLSVAGGNDSEGTLGDPVIQAMAQELSAVGITLTIKTGLDEQAWVAALESGQYPAQMFTQTPLLPMYEYYEYYLAPHTSLNTHGYDDPAEDKLYQEGSVATTTTKAQAYWLALSRRTVTQADFVPAFQYQGYWYYAKGIGGVTFSAATGYPYATDLYPTHT